MTQPIDPKLSAKPPWSGVLVRDPDAPPPVTDLAVPPRLASPPGLGAIRTGAAATLATALIAALEIANPALAIAAIAAGTGVLSWIGKTSRDYLNDPNDDASQFAPAKGMIASLFSWLG